MSKEQIEEMTKDVCGHCRSKCSYTYFECEMAIEAAYTAGYRNQEWISVDERLPEENGYYLVYTKYGYIEVERYKTWDDDDLDGGYWWEFEGLVTHWMPLPEPPKT